jgi:hypothetical protein
VASVLVLSPWAFAVGTYQHDLELGQHAVNQMRLDRWQNRLNLLPSDARCDELAPKDVSSPYLDCQIGYPLFILAASTSVLLLRRLSGSSRLAAGAFLVPPLFYSGVVLYLSMDAVAFVRVVPDEFRHIQFLYRLVSYVNLGFLLLLLFALLWATRRGPDAVRLSVSPLLLGFVLTYAGFCVVLKLQHAEVARIPSEPVVKAWAAQGRVYNTHCNHRRWMKNADDRDQLVELPITSYGHRAYAMPKHFTPLSDEEARRLAYRALAVESRGGRFGEHAPITVTMEQSGYLATNILVFPWNRFQVDGRVIPAEELRAYAEYSDLTAIPVPAGTHTIQYSVKPPPTWRALHRVSQVTLFVWVIGLGLLMALGMLRARKPAVPVPEEMVMRPADVPLPKVA